MPWFGQCGPLDNANVNGFFRRLIQDKRAGRGTVPTGSLEEDVMRNHRDLLPWMLVKSGVKIKTAIVRK